MKKFIVTASAAALAVVSNSAGAQVNVIGTATGCFYTGPLGSQCALGANSSSLGGLSYVGGGFDITVGPGGNHTFGDVADNIGVLSLTSAPNSTMSDYSLRIFVEFQSPTLANSSDILVGDFKFVGGGGNPRLQVNFSQTYTTFQYGSDPLQSFEFRGSEGSQYEIRANESLQLGFSVDCEISGTAACAAPTAVVNPDPIAVPEPATFALLAAGMLGVAGVARRRKQA